MQCQLYNVSKNGILFKNVEFLVGTMRIVIGDSRVRGQSEEPRIGEADLS